MGLRYPYGLSFSCGSLSFSLFSGRAIQGAGAISAPVTAFIADITREEHRTKAYGHGRRLDRIDFCRITRCLRPRSIALSGWDGIFSLIGALSFVAIWVTLAIVPPEPQSADDPMRRTQRGALPRSCRNTKATEGSTSGSFPASRRCKWPFSS